MRKSLIRILFAIFTTTLSTDAATVAYWRFETGPAGANVLHPGADGAFNGTITDVSGNGNNLQMVNLPFVSNLPYFHGAIPAVRRPGRTNMQHHLLVRDHLRADDLKGADCGCPAHN